MYVWRVPGVRALVASDWRAAPALAHARPGCMCGRQQYADGWPMVVCSWGHEIKNQGVQVEGVSR